MFCQEDRKHVLNFFATVPANNGKQFATVTRCFKTGIELMTLNRLSKKTLGNKNRWERNHASALGRNGNACVDASLPESQSPYFLLVTIAVHDLDDAIF